MTDEIKSKIRDYGVKSKILHIICLSHINSFCNIPIASSMFLLLTISKTKASITNSKGYSKDSKSNTNYEDSKNKKIKVNHQA